MRVTNQKGYDGAPSWSPDGQKIIFESCPESDPDESDGTEIFMIDISGLVAAKVIPSPFEYADVVTTTTHKSLRGPRGAMIFYRKDNDRNYENKINFAVFPGLQGGPHEHAIAGKAIAFHEALQPEFKEYAKQVVLNANHLAEELMKRDFKLVSDGTDTHLLLADLTNKGIPGKAAQNTLDEVGITLNKNTVPGDPRSPMDPSGIRLGTPAITTRGMKEAEMKKIADWIDRTTKAWNPVGETPGAR